MSDLRGQLRRAFADAIRQTSGGHRNYLYDREAGDYADAVLGLGEVVEQSEVVADLDGTYDADGRLIHNGCGREILYFDEGAICECGAEPRERPWIVLRIPSEYLGGAS